MENTSPAQTFNAKELKKNSDLKSELFELIASGEAILLVGSGLSISVGFPSWEGLLERLESLAQKVGNGFNVNTSDRKNYPLEYADRIKEHFILNSQLGRYNSELHKIFARKNPNFKEFHKKLLQLPFSLVLTTNYDTVLSDALTQIRKEEGKDSDPELCFAMNHETIPLLSNFLLSLHQGMKLQKKVAHLHGYYLRQNEIVLTKSDYEKCYFNLVPEHPQQVEQQLTLHFLVLWSLMATKRIIFVGFGMRDPYLIRLLKDVSVRLWRWERPTHINIAGIEPISSQTTKDHAGLLREEFGVDTFFYENTDNTHQQLEALIGELFEYCSPKASLRSQKEDVSHKTSSRKTSSKKKSSWVLETNKRLNAGVK